MQIQVYPDVQAISEAAARMITRAIEETLQEQELFTLVLSGGSTPKLLHGLLAQEPFRSKIDWSRVHLFWGDERCVPFEDERNNARMAFDTLISKVPVPPTQIHIMRTDIPAAESAAAYEDMLHTYFKEDGFSFDLLLLGMGDDGHTLSLFPGTEVVQEQQRWVSAFWLEAQQMERITLTAPLALRARQVFFLTAGAGKAKAFKEVIEGVWNPDQYPSQWFRKAKGEVYWLVDRLVKA